VIAFHKKFGAEIIRETDLDYFFDFSIDEYEKTKKKYSRFLIGKE